MISLQVRQPVLFFPFCVFPGAGSISINVAAPASRVATNFEILIAIYQCKLVLLGNAAKCADSSPTCCDDARAAITAPVNL